MFKDSLIFQILRDSNRKRRKLMKSYYHWNRKKEIELLNQLIPEDCSIISSNCVGGGIYQDLKRQYSSPTAGLFFPADDFNIFVRRIRDWKDGLSFTDHSKYPELEARRLHSKPYPIGLLNGEIEIHFLHYSSREEAAHKWNDRYSRINFDKFIVIGMQQNCCSESIAEDFNRLPVTQKFFFSTYYRPDLESNIYICPDSSQKGRSGICLMPEEK